MSFVRHERTRTRTKMKMASSPWCTAARLRDLFPLLARYVYEPEAEREMMHLTRELIRYRREIGLSDEKDGGIHHVRRLLEENDVGSSRVKAVLCAPGSPISEDRIDEYFSRLREILDIAGAASAAKEDSDPGEEEERKEIFARGIVGAGAAAPPTATENAECERVRRTLCGILWALVLVPVLLIALAGPAWIARRLFS